MKSLYEFQIEYKISVKIMNTLCRLLYVNNIRVGIIEEVNYICMTDCIEICANNEDTHESYTFNIPMSLIDQLA